MATWPVFAGRVAILYIVRIFRKVKEVNEEIIFQTRSKIPYMAA